MNDAPWYKDGLRFECTQCGACCTGAPGYVWVSKEEIEALAKALGYSVFEFESRFVRKVGKRKSLVELSNGDCILFDAENRCCRFYDLRPVQCRTWPFWNTNIDTPRSWAATAKYCPGCNRGELHPREEIDRIASERTM